MIESRLGVKGQSVSSSMIESRLRGERTISEQQYDRE